MSVMCSVFSFLCWYSLDVGQDACNMIVFRNGYLYCSFDFGFDEAKEFSWETKWPLLEAKKKVPKQGKFLGSAKRSSGSTGSLGVPEFLRNL